MQVGRSVARHSGRLQVSDSNRVLDEATRKRRQRKQVEALEQDNFHEDPHAQLHWHKNIPKFDDEQVVELGSMKRRTATTDGGEHGETARKKKKLRAEHFKQRFRKNFSALVEDETANKSTEGSGWDAYNGARAPPSRIPARHFCCACGFFSKYTCMRCGARYCSIKCRDLHNETRCLRWTV